MLIADLSTLKRRFIINFFFYFLSALLHFDFLYCSCRFRNILYVAKHFLVPLSDFVEWKSTYNGFLIHNMYSVGRWKKFAINCIHMMWKIQQITNLTLIRRQLLNARHPLISGKCFSKSLNFEQNYPTVLCNFACTLVILRF